MIVLDERGVIQHTSEEHTESALGVKFSPDGKVLASVGADKAIVLRSSADWSVTKKLFGHKREVNCVSFSPNNKSIVTGSTDTTALVWNIEKGELFMTLAKHTASVESMSYTWLSLHPTTHVLQPPCTRLTTRA